MLATQVSCWKRNLSLEKGLLQTCSNPACKKSVLVSDPYSPEAAVLNNTSIVGAKLTGCGLHAMEVIMACIGMVPSFTRAMWTKHKFPARTCTCFS